MSAKIQSLVLQRRAAIEQARIEQAHRQQFLADAKGDNGDKGDMPAHEWKSTKLRFEKPDGTWGPWVDLQGERGPRGLGGIGGSDIDLSALPLAEPSPPPQYVVIKQNGLWVRATWAQLQTWLGSPVIPANVATVDGENVTVNGEDITVT